MCRTYVLHVPPVNLHKVAFVLHVQAVRSTCVKLHKVAVADAAGITGSIGAVYFVPRRWQALLCHLQH